MTTFDTLSHNVGAYSDKFPRSLLVMMGFASFIDCKAALIAAKVTVDVVLAFSANREEKSPFGRGASKDFSAEFSDIGEVIDLSLKRHSWHVMIFRAGFETEDNRV